MSKNKTNPAVQVPKEQTRKQLSRAEREARLRRRILYSVGGVLAVVALVIVFGLIREAFIKPTEPVATVNGQAISTAEFQSRVKLVRAQLRQQAEFAQTINDTQSVENIVNQLQQPTMLGSQVLNGMVDELLLAQAAPDFNVSVSPEEIDAAIEEQFGYQRNPPTPAPTNTPRPTPTASGPVTQTATPSPTPLPTATPISQESARQSYQDYLGALQVSDQDYRKYMERNLLGEKVREALAGTVPTTTEQIKFQYIRIDASGIPTVTDLLAQNGFTATYQAILSSTFPYTSSAFASEVDWVPREAISSTEEIGPAVMEAFFSTPVGQVTPVVSNPAGTASYAALIADKGVQPLSSGFLQQAQSKQVEDWLSARRVQAIYLTWADRVPTTP
jgi:hypothetical protein